MGIYIKCVSCLCVFAFLAMAGSLPAWGAKEYMVDARAGPQRTDLFFHAGDRIQLKASGQWRMGDGVSPTGPEGHAAGPSGDNLVDGSRWGALMGKIAGGRPFAVGAIQQVAADQDGVLILYANLGGADPGRAQGAMRVSVEGGMLESERLQLSQRNGSAKVALKATDGVVDSGIAVRRGEMIKILASGQWTMWKGKHPPVGPEGHDLAGDGINTRLPDGSRWGALMARIAVDGLDNWLDAYPVFPVGHEYSFRSPRDGVLQLYPSAGRYRTPREGELTVLIEGGLLATPDFRQQLRAQEVQERRERMLTLVNGLRRKLNIPVWQADARLHKAAQAHADYLYANRDDLAKESPPPSLHAEEEEHTGFTGQNPDARVRQAGYPLPVQEVTCAIDSCMATLASRLPFLDPQTRDVGMGNAGEVMILKVGGDSSAASAQELRVTGPIAYTLYPLANQEGVPAAWHGDERPDPLPGRPRPFGFPLTAFFYFPDGKGVEIGQVRRSVLREPGGREVPHYQVPSGRAFSLVAAESLQPATRYEAELELVVNQKPAIVRWAFTTQAPAGSPGGSVIVDPSLLAGRDDTRGTGTSLESPPILTLPSTEGNDFSKGWSLLHLNGGSALLPDSGVRDGLHGRGRYLFSLYPMSHIYGLEVDYGLWSRVELGAYYHAITYADFPGFNVGGHLGGLAAKVRVWDATRALPLGVAVGAYWNAVSTLTNLFHTPFVQQTPVIGYAVVSYRLANPLELRLSAQTSGAAVGASWMPTPGFALSLDVLVPYNNLFLGIQSSVFTNLPVGGPAVGVTAGF